MKKFFFFFLFMTSFSQAKNLVFKYKGSDVASFSTDQIKSGALETSRGNIKSNSLKIFNLFRGYERTYEGFDFFELLTIVYGDEWKSQRKITFIATDGYNQFSLINKMLKASKGKKGHLAFSEKDKNGFSVFEKEGKKIDPGPFYLVWSNYTETDKASHADTLKWPYQLAVIHVE